MCCLPHPQGYLARPVTTVWAQGTMISLKLPWSKNPLCQDPFRAVGRRAEAQARGWVDKGPPASAWRGRLLSRLPKDSLTLTAQIPFFLENYTDTDPSPTPQHTKPGLQKIQQVRNSVHIEHPTIYINSCQGQTQGDPNHNLCLFFPRGRELMDVFRR